MNVRFLDPVKLEIAEAIDFYEQRQPGLGKKKLAEAVQQTLSRITADPTSYERVSKTIHRLRVSEFPYAFIYSVEPDEILVIAFMQLNRRPGYWKDRI